MAELAGGSGIGINPVSETQSYMFMTVADPDKTLIREKDQLEALRPLLIGHGPMVDAIRRQMDESYQINYRPLESLIVDRPWHRGRVLLIGAAAHSTTPHLGHGAGLAVEDAVVLGEELERSDDLDMVFERFMARWLPRARDVIESSWSICKGLAGEYHETMAMHAAAMGRLLAPT